MYIYSLHDNPNLFQRFLAFPIFLMTSSYSYVIKNIGMKRKHGGQVCANALAVYIFKTLRLDKSK